MLCVLLTSYTVFAEESEETIPAPFELEDEEPEPIVPMEVMTGIPKPAVPHKYALLLIESSCKMRNQWPGLRQYIIDDLAYYPTITTKIVGGNPRLRIFEDQTDLENATIDASQYTVEQMIEILNKLRDNPNYFDPKKSVIDLEIPQDATPEDLNAFFEKMGVEKGLTYDPKKRPILYEELQEKYNREGTPGPVPYDMDEILKEVELKTGEKAPAEKLEPKKFPPMASGVAGVAAGKDEL